MAELRPSTTKMIYTPDRHIPVGEAVKMAEKAGFVPFGRQNGGWRIWPPHQTCEEQRG